jgi:hypothetical protein
MSLKTSPSRYSDWSIAILFVLCLLLPLVVWFVQGDASFSETEKRPLQQFPKISSYDSVTSWSKGFDAYYQDHFGFREWFIHRHQRELSKRFGVSGVAEVIEGREQWLYLAGGDILDDLKGKLHFSDAHKTLFWQQLRQRQAWLGQQGCGYLFLVAPSKQSIYPEFMPKHFQTLRGQSRLDDLLASMPSQGGGALLDIRKQLIAAKSGARLYDRSDTHWNLRGAYVAYVAIMERLQSLVKPAPAMETLHFAALYEDTPAGDLAGMMGEGGSRREQSPRFEKSVFSATLKGVAAPIATMLSLPQLKVAHTVKAGRGLRVLVLHDSFFERLKPMVSESFGEVLYVWRYYDAATMGFFSETRLQELVALYKPDLVIEELVERNLPFYLPQITPSEGQ